ncbi:MAG TPA: hypothetical protein VK735_33435 [Pseudonocardia sp.]|jgi:hypothetical protein|uniref:hypothetical protein n=1 Tax=Pseudonocardia sp. TaxID=60912 RepID=UPI002CCD3609|nr:hypothetical protein [Pseudonocardia sp.]HTF52374.1 hypothetical protein [Pseudonocardia sp.]
MARPTRVMMTAAAAVVVAAIAGGVAYAATPHSTATAPAAASNAATPAPASPAPAVPLRRLLAHAEYGEFTTAAATGGTQTLDVQRGVITAVDANSLTVRSTAGYTATYTITPSTTIRHPEGWHHEGRHHEGRRASFGAPEQTPQSGQPSQIGAAGLQPNESVMVLATKTATGDTAMRIVPARNVA